MPDAPLASVIILGYWGREFVDDCLSSVLDQDLPPDQYEVLYIDNGSRDGSPDFVRERFPQARTLALDRNYGYAEGNNIGFRDTRGEIAVFLNQDTVAHRSLLRELTEALRSSPTIAAAHANIIQPWYPESAGIAERGGRIRLKAIAEPPSQYKDLLDVFRNVLAHEEEVTAAINSIYDLAASEKDYATQTLLDWYVNEQVEEENQPAEIISMLERVGDSSAGLLMVDRHLAVRARGS